jgi:hypothetical protein
MWQQQGNDTRQGRSLSTFGSSSKSRATPEAMRPESAPPWIGTSIPRPLTSASTHAGTLLRPHSRLALLPRLDTDAVMDNYKPQRAKRVPSYMEDTAARSTHSRAIEPEVSALSMNDDEHDNGYDRHLTRWLKERPLSPMSTNQKLETPIHKEIPRHFDDFEDFGPNDDVPEVKGIHKSSGYDRSDRIVQRPQSAFIEQPAFVQTNMQERFKGRHASARAENRHHYQPHQLRIILRNRSHR